MGRVCLLNSTGTEVVQPASKTDIDTMSAKITACNTGAVVVSSSALPSGAALESGGNLAAIAAAVGPYAALHPGSREMTSSSVGLFPAWSGAVEYTEGGIVVIAETGKVYLALQTGTNQPPASQPLFWRELTLRGALLEAPSGNSDDIMWGTLISQNQTFSPGDKIILKITTAAIVSLGFDGDSPDVVNYVIFE